jgi:hypothetical protein
MLNVRPLKEHMVAGCRRVSVRHRLGFRPWLIVVHHPALGGQLGYSLQDSLPACIHARI